MEFFLTVSDYIKYANDENKEKYKLGNYQVIQYQILQTNITRTVWQTVRWITNEILGVKGLILHWIPLILHFTVVHKLYYTMPTMHGLFSITTRSPLSLCSNSLFRAIHTAGQCTIIGLKVNSTVSSIPSLRKILPLSYFPSTQT